MKLSLPGAAIAAGGLILGVEAGAVTGNILWKRVTARLVTRLLATAPSSPAVHFRPAEVSGLPAPVVRYFEYALTPGQLIFPKIRVSQTGEMRVGGPDSPWKPFSAAQWFTDAPPGFVWDAHIQMGPLLTVAVRDSYVGGAGAGQVRLASLLTFPGQSDRPELNAGALHRYLAEAVWCPTALLPSRGVVWEPIEDRAALATLRDGATLVSLEFRFGPEGEIRSAYTPERFRAVKRDYVPTPWLCSYSDYAPRHGMQVPLQGEVAWILPEGRFSCFRSRLLDVLLLGDSPPNRRRQLGTVNGDGADFAVAPD